MHQDLCYSVFVSPHLCYIVFASHPHLCYNVFASLPHLCYKVFDSPPYLCYNVFVSPHLCYNVFALPALVSGGREEPATGVSTIVVSSGQTDSRAHGTGL